jgi:hypothetical protein
LTACDVLLFLGAGAEPRRMCLDLGAAARVMHSNFSGTAG